MRERRSPTTATRARRRHGERARCDRSRARDRLGQAYEEVRAPLPVGASIVLYTDGVIEARRDGELYGAERLDALLAADNARSPAELARAVTEDARAFARGEISDDLAVVVIRRTA